MRRIALAGILLAGLLAIGWTALWFVLAKRTEHAIDSWIADEKSRDRIWACASRRTSGFPFSLQIECVSPTFSSQAGPVKSATATRLTAGAHIYPPFDISYSVDAPMKVATPNGAATLSWADLTGAIKTGGGAPDVSVHARNLQISEASADAAAWRGASAQDLRTRVQRAPDRAPGADAQVVTIKLEGVRAMPIDALVGNEETLNASLTTVLLNAGAAATGNFAERLDKWSSADGRLQISSFTAAKGNSRIEASGDLTVDERRRPAGQLSVRLSGLQPILARLKVPAAPLAIEGLLRDSGNRNGGASLLENRTIPLELRGGRMYVGPLRMPLVIPPLI